MSQGEQGRQRLLEALSKRGDLGTLGEARGLAHELNGLCAAGGASRGAAATLLQGRR